MPSENFIVAGTNHYLQNLLPLLQEDSSFSEKKSFIAEHYFDGDRIYKFYAYDLPTVQLIDEPDNEYDPKAIRVEFGGAPVGYIKKGSTGRVRNLLKDPTAVVSAEFKGGPYKDVFVDEDNKVSVERGENAYTIKLTITTGGADGPATDDSGNDPHTETILKDNPPVDAAGTQPTAAKPKKKFNPIWLWIFAAIYIIMGFSLSGVVYKVITFGFAAVLIWLAIKLKKNQKDE